MSTRRALLIGGTGPTGPHLLAGLLDRGLDVTMFHTGRHEIPGQPDVPHIHGDPFSAEGIAQALGQTDYDVVIATYGRVKLIARHFAELCQQFLFVGGTPVYRGMVHPEDLDPPGLPTPVREDHPRVAAESDPTHRYGVAAIRRVEDAVFALDSDGAFDATVFRYPTIYGPRNPHPWEWTIVGRAVDRRPFVFVPDDGRGTHSRCGARNAAHSLLLAIDRPNAAAGKAYNVADDQVVSIRQWAEITAALTARRLNAEPLEVRAFPGSIPQPGWGMIAFGYQGTPNCIVDTSAIRADLGYRDVQPVESGLDDVVAEMLAAPEAYRDHANNVDPFDYATEDRLAAEWGAMQTKLQQIAQPIAAELATMPTPQTASGGGASGGGASSGGESGGGASGGAASGGAASVEPTSPGPASQVAGSNRVDDLGALPPAVAGYFAAINDEDWDGLRAVLAADVVVRPVGMAPVNGVEQAIAHYRGLLADYPHHVDTPTRALVADNSITVEIDYEGRTTNGTEITFQATDVFDLVGDRIARVAIWFDTHDVRRQLRG